MTIGSKSLKQSKDFLFGHLIFDVLHIETAANWAVRQKKKPDVKKSALLQKEIEDVLQLTTPDNINKLTQLNRRLSAYITVAKKVLEGTSNLN